MEIVGAEIFSRLQQAQQELRQQALGLRQEWKKVDEHLDDLVSRRAAAIVELTNLYLPNLSAETINSSFAEIRTELRQIHERQQRHVTELTSRQQRLREEVQRLDVQLAEVRQQQQLLSKRQRQLSQQVAERLSRQNEFQRLSKRVLETEGELRKDEARSDDLRKESAAKLPAYQRSRLFQYLLRRKYGSDEYTGRGWVRRMDRWLAGLIGFASAKRGYDFLLKAPDLVGKEVARRRQEFQLQMEQMEVMEERFAHEAGLTKVLDQQRQQTARSAQLDQRRQQQLGMAADVERQLLSLDREGGPFYVEALQRLRQFLERAAISVLQQRARQTPSPIDDEIVTRIDSLNREIEATQPRIQRLEQDCRTAETRVDDFSFVLRRFQQANFETVQSRFSPQLDLPGLLPQFQSGVLSREAFWETLRNQQRFEPTALERQATEVVMHPMTGVLLEAMVQALGGGTTSQIERSVRRRSAASNETLTGSMPLPPMQLPRWERHSTPAASSPSRPHGYSSGKGF